MKKKVFIFIIVFVLLITGVIIFLFSNNKKEELSILTLDINPSIEINVDKDNNVKDVKAINEDAKEIISEDFKGKFLDDVIKAIMINLYDKGYFTDDLVTMLLYYDGTIDPNKVEASIRDVLDEKQIQVEIVQINKATKEDKELAKKYNISLGKATYINSISKNNENITVDYLLKKELEELKETEETGNYCDEGYVLEKDSCLKEIERYNAKKGSVCPRGYYDYNGKCYEETAGIKGTKLYCRGNLKLVDNDCVESSTYNAVADCESGKYDGTYCIEEKYVADAYEFCRDSGRTLYQHKCLATKPTINGGCLGSDMLYKGKCVNTKNDYYAAEWKCPNGRVLSNADGSLLNNSTKCYEEVKTKPKTYHCNEPEAVLNGTKCTVTHHEAPEVEMSCPSGYTLINNGTCINKNKTISKESGYYCDKENARQEGSVCVVYERVEAKHN